MRIDLSDQEIEQIKLVLKERLAELSEEIHHADVSGFRDQLKDRKALLEGILQKLEGQK